jgi:hypothetical protein
MTTLTINLTIVLNASIVHHITSFHDFSIFVPSRIFFGIFSSKIEVYDLDLA